MNTKFTILFEKRKDCKIANKQKSLSVNKPARLGSVDVLRGLTIMLMVFVNDIGHIASTPGWMKHFPKELSGMTIADWVFPGFLFVMGMTIPAAIEKRRTIGQSWWKITWHIFVRVVSLLVIGVLLLNDHPDDAAIGWPDGLWRILMLCSVFAVWHSLPAKVKLPNWFSPAVRITGAFFLIYLVVVFKGEDGQWIKTAWWGILGILGYAYLICSLIYIGFRDNRTILVGLVALLICAGIAEKQGRFDGFWLTEWVKADVWGSRTSITLSGMVLGTLFLAEDKKHKTNIRWAICFGVILLAAGWLLIPLHGIHKIGASASWCLLCSGITCLVWALLCWLIDIKGFQKWLRWPRLVGLNPLFAYLFAYMVYAAFTVFDTGYFGLNDSVFAIGLARAVLYTATVGTIAGLLGAKGYRLKL